MISLGLGYTSGNDTDTDCLEWSDGGRDKKKDKGRCVSPEYEKKKTKKSNKAIQFFH